MTLPRVVIADDHALIRSAVLTLLASHYDVVGQAGDGQALVAEATRLRPELVILDVSMPGLNGIDAAGQILRRLPRTKVVFLSMHASPIYLRMALATGASAYVLKSAAAEQLLEALATARSGRAYVSPEFGASGALELQVAATGSRAVIGLTPRQREVLQLIAEGRQNKEIATSLGVSVKTVEFHRGRLMAKLNAHSVAELTRCALQQKLVEPIA